MKLEEVYKNIQPSVYAFFYVKTFHKETAEDLTQGVFYQAVKGHHTFSGKSTIKTWVFAIAKNVLKKHFRSGASKAGANTIIQHEEAACLSPEEHFLKNVKERRLLEEINRLDETSQEIVTLRIYGELSFKEISMLTGKTENYARVGFHRAKVKLQQEMEGYDEG
ncbi:sigma-70 family RNA polymerase sigma factor [Bacillus haynesii]|uniref:RNA polymerase sigma factor n=1 Tax=Bacillus haynesii TaxID=1925021 RepID=UPI0022810CFD|nr:sigma-70 family RNA polymerase sigma factor [Bacillus haynesii]MCY7772439.1 sigma-70 family RNA polymerase sigma factor [Bacillus haynesii]MCY8013949.1 sigma-70 family RNA polymerase sigma factor [Bacillus haynesii]MCY9371880.1 sigma-70 family RNA polymerase sigma factor [Bacillus haynesii]MEC0722701.1 sigma-70 family RNA polymerase sigma factor [Bacillus haynesii]MEC0764754.1 sigma-70 family RNA polymerase sigma factor [Bacillus haynesii]